MIMWLQPNTQGCTQGFFTVFKFLPASVVWTENIWCAFGVTTLFLDSPVYTGWGVLSAFLSQWQMSFIHLHHELKRQNLLIFLFSKAPLIVQLNIFPGTILFLFQLFWCWHGYGDFYLSLSRTETNTSEAKKLRKLIYFVVKMFSGARKIQSLPILHHDYFWDTMQQFFKTWNLQIIERYWSFRLSIRRF